MQAKFPTMIDKNVARAFVRAGTYLLRRTIVGKSPQFKNVSKRSTLICGGHVVKTIKPYFEETHLARIRDTRHYSAEVIINEHLNRQQTELRPVRIHWVDDAWLIDGSVFLRGAERIDLRNALERRSALRHYSLLPALPYAELNEGVIAATSAGSTWFGHWLEDEVPLLMLSRAYGRPIAHERIEFAHEAPYLAALKLKAPERFGIARIATLGIIEEFAQNPNKTLRYETIRARLSRRPKGRSRIFLYRGASGTPRNLVNERELAVRLEREGFITVDVGTATFDDLLNKCIGASVVVSVEGSQLAHALFMMQDYGTMLILCPPNQVHTTVAEIGVFCRLTSGMFVCEEVASPDGSSGFFANPDEVLRFLDRLVLHGERARSSLAAYVDEVIALGGNGHDIAPPPIETPGTAGLVL